MKLQRTLLRVSGQSRTSFLNRMLTQTLHPQTHGQYGLLLEPNGQLISGAYWLHRDEAWWAFTHEVLAETLAEGLQKYIFFRDDVTLHILRRQTVTATSTTAGTFIDTGECALIDSWQDQIDETPYDPAPIARRRAGVPVFGLEVQPGDNALEWDMGYCLAQKGCYVGQEVIERMWSRARRARGRVLVESPFEIGHAERWDDAVCGSLEVRAPQYDPAMKHWIALGLCKIVPDPMRPWHLDNGLTVHNLARGGELPASLSQIYSAWATLSPTGTPGI